MKELQKDCHAVEFDVASFKRNKKHSYRSENRARGLTT
jgi:hypothetical protein